MLGSLALAVWEGKEVLARLQSDIHLHPPSHWGGTGISDERTHVDVPLCELASLALRFAKDGGDRDETVRRMAQHFELGRFRSVTQERFERAYRRAVGD